MWRIVYWMNENYHVPMAKYLMNELNLNEKQLKELQSYQCPKPKVDHYFKYWNKKISDDAINKLLNAAKQ